MKKNDKIYIAGHTGLVGSAIYKKLLLEGYKNLITVSRKNLDLVNQSLVENFFKKKKPKIVILCAAKVGGIYANDAFPAEFIYQNLMIQTNLINAAFRSKVKKFIFLGSSCIYPKQSKQPIKEKYLLSGKLEKTNMAYAVSKIAGLIMCKSYNNQYKFKTDYRCLMPTNLYGPNDNYHALEGHVIPSLIKRIHEAKIKNKKKVAIWGTGTPKREFLFSEDLADAVLFFLKMDKKKFHKFIDNEFGIVNVGSGSEYTINNLAKIIKKIIGYKGQIINNNSMPDGTKRKYLSSKIIKRLGWKPKCTLHKGLKITYGNFLKKYAK